MNSVVPEAALVVVVVEYDVVVIRRSALRESVSAVIVAYSSAIDSALELADGDVAPGVILDVRLAPGSNGPSFEKSLVVLRRRLEERFHLIVTLVHSSVGALQAGHLAREMGLSEVIVRDVAEAVERCGEPR